MCLGEGVLELGDLRSNSGSSRVDSSEALDLSKLLFPVKWE